MPSVEVFILETCNECGFFADHCPSKKIEMKENRPQIASGCIACARCMEYCQEEAIEVTIIDPDYIRKTIEWVSQEVDVS